MRRPAILLLISMILCSCATLEGKQRDSEFKTTTTLYAKAIRWGDFKGAEQMRRLADSQPAKPMPANNVRVTGYKTLQVIRAADGNEINITVQIDYYRMGEMKLESITDQQTWEYDSEAEHWYITTALPEF
jgi:hypothetical protein